MREQETKSLLLVEADPAERRLVSAVAARAGWITVASVTNRSLISALPQPVGAVSLDGTVVIARQLPERRAPVGVQVEKVARRLLIPTREAPQIRIDAVLHDERAPAIEERLELGR